MEVHKGTQAWNKKCRRRSANGMGSLAKEIRANKHRKKNLKIEMELNGVEGNLENNL